MIVVETKNGAESLLNQTIPWYRIRIQSSHGTTLIRMIDEKSKFVKIDGKVVQTKFKGSGKLSSRLQDRAARKWANESDEPIQFQPIEESMWLWVPLLTLMAGACLYMFFPLLKKIPNGTFSTPLSPSQLYTIGGLLIAACLLSLPVLLLWRMRPRAQSFQEIDLLPTGIVGTTQTGEVVTLIFEDLATLKLKVGNPTRCRMKTKNGIVYWMALPPPINRFARCAINPSNETQKESKATAIQAIYHQGVRLFVIGVVLASISYALINYLASIGAILPADVRLIRRGMVGFSLLYPWGTGFWCFWIAWKTSPRGQRILKRFKARLFKSKDNDPQNTTP